MKADSQYKRYGLPADHALRRQAHTRRHGILKALQAIRDGNAPKPREAGSLGRVALAIPELDFWVLVRRFPDLNSLDAEIQHKAWIKFLRSPLSQQYRVSRERY